MRVQPVVAQADAEPDRDPVERDGHQEQRPGEVKQRGHGADVEQHHDDARDPVDDAVALRRSGQGGYVAQRELLNEKNTVTTAVQT